jgi:predicted  nucleic acid-binding Zn-ribbon protein
MRGLDIVLSERIKELELEADRAMDRTILLRKQAKETAFKIKSLEEKVEAMEEDIKLIIKYMN